MSEVQRHIKIIHQRDESREGGESILTRIQKKIPVTILAILGTTTQMGCFLAGEKFAIEQPISDAGNDNTTDATPETLDGSIDATNDVINDVATDTSEDATNDVINDVAIDTSEDATNDVINDVATDTSEDATNDVINDVAIDTSEDATNDVINDVAIDTSEDATLDANYESGPWDANTDGGCSGVLYTFDMQNYEIIIGRDEASACTIVLYNSAEANNNWENNPQTYCLTTGDRVTLVVNNNSGNDCYFVTESVVSDPNMRRKGVNVSGSIDPIQLHNLCKSKLIYTSVCTLAAPTDQDPDPLKFHYLGAPDCDTPNLVANTYQFITP